MISRKISFMSYVFNNHNNYCKLLLKLCYCNIPVCNVYANELLTLISQILSYTYIVRMYRYQSSSSDTSIHVKITRAVSTRYDYFQDHKIFLLFINALINCVFLFLQRVKNVARPLKIFAFLTLSVNSVLINLNYYKTSFIVLFDISLFSVSHLYAHKYH